MQRLAMKPCTIKDYQLWCNGQWVIIYIARYFNSAYYTVQEPELLY